MSNTPVAPVMTRSGRIVMAPKHLVETMDVMTDFQGIATELRYLACLTELDKSKVHWNLKIRASIGGRFEHTHELKVMNYQETMKSPNARAWKDKIENKYN